MILHTRTAAPACLAREAEWATELCAQRVQYYREYAEYEAGRRRKRPAAVGPPRNRYGSAEVRTALRHVFFKSCGYCDGPLGANSYKRVDHFRPHSIYPRLGFRWSNLIQACEVCNGHKLDQFPLRDGFEPVPNRADPCAMDDTDANMLLDPCVDDPDDHLEWFREIVVGKTDRGKKTVECVGLDREDLEDDRRYALKLVQIYVLWYKKAESRGDDRARAKAVAGLKSETDETARFVAMKRAFVAAAGIDWRTL